MEQQKVRSKNKKILRIIGGIALTAGVITLGCFGIKYLSDHKNLNAIKAPNFIQPPNEIQQKRPYEFKNHDPFLVKGHTRNLPQGQTPSPAKINEAKKIGIELAQNQTYVKDYFKNLFH